jgi:hypothetical protein
MWIEYKARKFNGRRNQTSYLATEKATALLQEIRDMVEKQKCNKAYVDIEVIHGEGEEETLIDADFYDPEVSILRWTRRSYRKLLNQSFLCLMQTLTSERIPRGTTRTCPLCEEDETIDIPHVDTSVSRIQRHIDTNERPMAP